MMEYIYVIIILLVIWALFEFSQRYIRANREFYQNQREEFENPESKTYFEENTLVNFGDNMTGSAVNIRTFQRGQATTFGTSGETPAYLQCPQCHLQFDCTNYPYQVDGKNTSVCSSCIEKRLYNEFNMPVYAKSVGSPRKCRDLVAA